MNVAEEEPRRVVIHGERDDVSHGIESDGLHRAVSIQLGEHLQRVDFRGFGVKEERVEVFARDAI